LDIGDARTPTRGWARWLKPFAPALHTTRNYSARKFRRDLVAGLTVAVVELPQAMAYALIAGAPPQYGIYTSIIQGVLGALLTSSEHLTTGPTNTQSLLIASAVSRVVDPTGSGAAAPLYLQLVFCLTFLKGVIQLTMSAVGFGDLVRFISRSVILGVASGAGVLILAGQLGNLLGVAPAGPSTLPGALGSLHKLGANLLHPNWTAVAIGLGGVALILGGRAVSKFIPGALIAVVLSAAAVMAFGLEGKVATLGTLPATLPAFTWPVADWSLFAGLIPGALALSLLGGIETIAIGKTLATRSGERIDPNQEFFAQGLKNLLSSFFQCIPGSGSFTRSALDYEAGAETRYAAVMNAVFVGVLYFAFASYAQHIPYAALAAVLFSVAFGLIDFRYPLRIWRADRSDAVVYLVTFAATVLLPLEYAIFIGIFLNIAFYLQSSARLHMAEMVPTAGGTFLERDIYDAAGNRQVVLLQLEGELFFAVADELQDQLTRLRRSGARVVILRLKRTHSVDASVLHVLENFAKDTQRTGGHVLLCGMRPELTDRLRAYGLVRAIGEDNVFATGGGTFTSVRQALRRARHLVGNSIDTAGIKVDDEDEAEYQI
jgi:SulP family sulfate permease